MMLQNFLIIHIVIYKQINEFSINTESNNIMAIYIKKKEKREIFFTIFFIYFAIIVPFVECVADLKLLQLLYFCRRFTKTEIGLNT